MWRWREGGAEVKQWVECVRSCEKEKREAGDGQRGGGEVWVRGLEAMF